MLFILKATLGYWGVGIIIVEKLGFKNELKWVLLYLGAYTPHLSATHSPLLSEPHQPSVWPMDATRPGCIFFFLKLPSQP